MVLSDARKQVAVSIDSIVVGQPRPRDGSVRPGQGCDEGPKRLILSGVSFLDQKAAELVSLFIAP